MRTADFDFDLPRELIAQEPVFPRQTARLLDLASDPHGPVDRTFAEFGELLRPGDLLVFNRSKVIPARLSGRRERVEALDAAVGPAIEVTLVEAPEHQDAASPGEWKTLSRPGKRLVSGDTIHFSDTLSAQVTDKAGALVTMRFSLHDEALFAELERIGSMPLPPYIKRDQPRAKDAAHYRHFAGADPGSLAAPTASLHFDQEMVDQLISERGVHYVEVTLHIGYGTFAPVTAEKIADHQLHAEWCAITPETAKAIAETRANGGRIVAIGTTVLRTLEALRGAAGSKRTRLFITPGFEFQVVDALVTNFHLPRSTLFMLVCAFAGTERMQGAYAHAIGQRYRFFSYGDGCFLRRQDLWSQE